MGVPSVMPCSTPDWIATRSFSSRCAEDASESEDESKEKEEEGKLTHGGGEVGLARSTTTQLDLHILVGQRHARRNAIDDAAHRSTV